MLQQEEEGDKAEQSGAEPSAEEQALQQQQQQQEVSLQVQPLLHKRLFVYTTVQDVSLMCTTILPQRYSRG